MMKMAMKMTHCLSSRFVQVIPLPWVPKMSWETRATYGAMSPFWFGGGGHVTKERRSVTQHDRDHTGSFTQVRAIARRKTLLMLWWIDGG